MRNLYTLGLALCVAASGTITANERVAKPVAGMPLRVHTTSVKQQAPSESDIYKVTVLLRENFSAFKDGTEDAPAEAAMEDAQGWLPVAVTPTSGRWSGEKVHSAGGCAYIGYEGGLSGTLATPNLELSDADVRRPIVVTLRSKKLKNESERDWIYVALMSVSPTGEIRQFQGNYDYIYADWNDYTFICDFVREPGMKYYFQFYGYEDGAYVDDIEIKFRDPYVKAPETRPHSGFHADGFTANWNEVQGAESYLVSLYTLNKDRFKTRNYLVEDFEVTGNSHAFTGIETNARAMYYVVKARKGGKVSPESAPMKVEALVTPADLTVTRTDEGVQLSWKPVEGVWYYQVVANRDYTPEVDEEFVLSREDFNSFGWTGTPLAPSQNLDDQYEFDGKTGMSGWISQFPQTIENAFGLDGTMRSYYNEDVYLQSPYYDFTISGGVVNVKADLLAIDEITGASYKPYIQLLNYTAEDNKLTRVSSEDIKGLSDEWTTVKTTLTGGSASGVVEFCARGGWLYIDNIELSVPLKGGTKVSVPYRDFTTEETSVVFPIDELLSGKKLGYAVRAVKEVWDDYGYSRDYYVYSDFTPYGSYSVEASGVEDIPADSADALCDVYNLQGIVVLRGATPADIRTLPAGIYIAGGRKIAVK